jgi:predicted aldo/keto reductase-like oxidoreductase
MHDPSAIDRREFLRRTAAAGVALGVSPLAAGAAADPPRVRRVVRLGRTGLEIPDIGFGGSSLAGDEALVRHALERGITYFDTAEGYKGGRSEETLGRALAGVRDEVILASKVMAGADESRADFMASLEASLRRLRTDRIDVYFNHAVNSVDRIANPEWPEFVALARKQGKIRWSGMSGHGGQLALCIEYALDHDLIDVMLVAHNFGQDPSFTQRFTARLDFVAVQPDLPRLMKKAREKDVGVIAMKTLRGARLNDMRPFEKDGATYAQAAFRWVLAGPDVDALIVTMKSPEQVDEYLGASGATRPTNADVSLLQGYEARNGATQCRYGCGACADACPEGVPIAEVLRTRMYARDYEDLDLARKEYAALGAAASACVGCAHVSCVGACPFGIAIERHTEPTHRLLDGA